MRKVIYSEYVKKTEGDPVVTKSYWKLEEKGEALFHEFGCNYEELDGGAGNFSTAIIELDDGTIKNIPVENIRFVNPSNKE